jgi:acyl carrier protein
MGLDSVELLMEVEDAFGFSIPDEDAAGMDTVGKLYDYILAHRVEGKQEGCLTSVAFYRLRRVLTSICGLARRDVHPSIETAKVIPAMRRRRWSQLQASMGLRLPALRRPAWVTATATILGCALVVAAAVFLAARGGTTAIVLLGACVIVAVPWLLYQVTLPLAVVIPTECATVGGLAKAILQKNYGAISDQCQRANAEEAWTALRDLIVKQLGVRPDEVTREASFVKDLRVD